MIEEHVEVPFAGKWKDFTVRNDGEKILQWSKQEKHMGFTAVGEPWGRF
jgi:hypothetical protein